MPTSLTNSTNNPGVIAHGAGPDGRQCKDCLHLQTQTRAGFGVHRCGLLPNKLGQQWTHLKMWPVCEMFADGTGGGSGQ